MKKILLVSLLLLTIIAAKAQYVDVNQAKQTAEKWLTLTTKASPKDLSCVYTQTNERDYFYIFNSESTKNYVIVSADERILPILGYSNEGCFDINNFPPNMKGWLDGYVDEINYIFSIENVTKHPDWERISNGTTEKGSNAVNPLITTNWDQSPYYNALCPGGSVTGCVATAMAMIMKYWDHPLHGFGQKAYYHATWGIIQANFGEAYYLWSQMPNVVNSPNNAVATLMFHCGVSVSMDYGVQSSGAYTQDVANALKSYFGYQQICSHLNKADYQITAWENMMRAELDLSRPMEYHGNSVQSGGHAFVLDGYNNNNQFHFNWGWSGYANGYFTISNLNPIGYNFNNDQGSVMYIEPRWDLFCNAPINVLGSVNGTTANLSWSAPQPSSLNLVEYIILKDGVQVATTTSTNYSEDNLIFGEYQYCVKASYDNACISEGVCCTINSYNCLPISNLTATVDTNTVKLTWLAPINAQNVQYSIWRGDSPIGETTETHFDDLEVPIGTHEYCVFVVYSSTFSSGEVCTPATVLLGIENVGTKPAVYPNPANDYVSISNLNMSSIKIINNLGSTVKTIYLTSDFVNIDIKDLTSGFYVVVISTADGNSIASKLVISR